MKYHKQLTTLLIEHDQLTLRMLNGILIKNGSHVIARGSPEGITAVLPMADIVLCSYDMPYVMSDLVRIMRTLKPGIQIYMSSVTVHQELAPEVIRNIDGYLPRPFRLDTLTDFIHRCIQPKRGTDDEPMLLSQGAA